jgi:phycocyanobilin:ferredoxin oxidoreductase
MSNIWNELIKIQSFLEEKFNSSGIPVPDHGFDRITKPGWTNKGWTSDQYRRAHMYVVDARTTKGLWMMHCCIFPHTHNPAPIFGLDVIAGKNKITGCFHDFSPAGDDNHPLIEWFAHEVSELSWSKQRKLPEWAERIFTTSMIAASNVQKQEEVIQIVDIVSKTIEQYLNTVADTNNTAVDTTFNQNYYAQNQKQNPHNVNVMLNLGMDIDNIDIFVNEFMFPEIPLIN